MNRLAFEREPSDVITTTVYVSHYSIFNEAGGLLRRPAFGITTVSALWNWFDILPIYRHFEVRGRIKINWLHLMLFCQIVCE